MNGLIRNIDAISRPDMKIKMQTMSHPFMFVYTIKKIAMKVLSKLNFFSCFAAMAKQEFSFTINLG